MIYTGSYNNCKNSNVISISGDRGKSVGFNGDYYKPLAPKLSFWTEWHNNIGKIPEQENNAFYIKQYYETTLKLLMPEEVYRILNGKILLCYEEPELFCHRHIVAAWIETELGIVVPEVKVVDDEFVEIPLTDEITREYKRLILIRKKA